MKKLTTLFLLLATLCASAQNFNVDQIVMSDRDRASACEGPYRFDAPALTPSPEGYKPFYISHYGRHGSRYAWNDDTYRRPARWLAAADSLGVLTERGRKLHDDYMEFYMEPLLNTGNLSALGWEQHSRIAAGIAESFPEVFEGGGVIAARASTSGRAIVSMGAFVSSLGQHFPGIVVVANSLATNLVVINPTGAPDEIRERYAGEPGAPEGIDDNEFARRKIHPEEILSKIFTDWKFLGGERGEMKFVRDLNDLWRGYRNYCDSGFLEDLFTPEQALAFWELDNYDNFEGHTLERYDHIPLLQDIEERADAAIAGSGVPADLRFGHDTCLNAFYALLNVNGCGYIPEKADYVKYWFQNYNTPMASTLLFVLYRPDSADGDILFKVLQNGAEAALPQLQPVCGPYYRWSEFKAWCASIYEAHPLR